MAFFSEILQQKILSAEGGYQENPLDPGNKTRCGTYSATNFGITPNAWQNYTGVKCPDKAIMRAITVEQAVKFMNWYGKFYRVWEISDQDIAELVFNGFYGNPTQAAKVLQQVLNTRNYRLADDGIMGSRTIAAVNVEASKDKVGLYNQYRQAWADYLASIGSATFGTGWKNRMDTYFPPIIEQPQYVQPSAPKKYGWELFKARLSGALKSRTDAIWVFGSIIGLGMVVVAFRMNAKK